jgi:alpha-galactosidase
MASERSKKGDLVPDLKRFPSGMKALGEKIHSMGMKFGIYESAGVITCQHLPGSLGTPIGNAIDCRIRRSRR